MYTVSHHYMVSYKLCLVFSLPKCQPRVLEEFMAIKLEFEETRLHVGLQAMRPS